MDRTVFVMIKRYFVKKRWTISLCLVMLASIIFGALFFAGKQIPDQQVNSICYYIAFCHLLAIYGAIIMAIFVFLRVRGISDRIAIFTSFAAFGIVTGFDAAMYGNGEYIFFHNSLGVLLGNRIDEYSMNHFGDLHSDIAHYTVPWILRTPQLYFFTSAILFGLIGLVVQIIFNLIKKTPSTKTIPNIIVILLILAGFGISGGIVYAEYPQYPTHSSVLPIKIGGITRYDKVEWENWDYITSYEVESITYSPEIIEKGYGCTVRGMVKNVGSEQGRVIIEIDVEGITASNDTALLPGESKPVSFYVVFPREGTYTVKIENISEDITVIE